MISHLKDTKDYQRYILAYFYTVLIVKHVTGGINCLGDIKYFNKIS